MTDDKSHRLDPAHWDGRYQNGDIPWELGHPDPYVQGVIERYAVTPCRALEVGCGNGHNAIWLGQKGFDVLGIDVSVTAIEAARALAQSASVEARFEVANILEGPAAGAPYGFAFDRAVMHLFEQVEHRSRYVANLAASLRPGALYHTLSGSTDGPPRNTTA